jgi:hypothetical protein
MISKYYYLISSLPYLRLGQKNSISTEQFLSECRKWLHAQDIEVLERVSIEDFSAQPNSLPALTAWKEFDFNLRKELALARDNMKHGRHEKPGPLAKIVLEESTPLLMEQALARIRWGYLDSLEMGNFFDLNFLILYFLKLQIIARLDLFDNEKGEKVFHGMCEVHYE